MAFQQPQPRPQAPRQQQASPPPPSPVAVADAHAQTNRRNTSDSEWILFSPQNADDQSASYTSQTPRTATHLSDFGSLETHIRSQARSDSRGPSDVLGYQASEYDDDGTELDSLDDGLHAFHHPIASNPSNLALDQSGGAVLPTHDGFGTFPSDIGLQEHLWQFERYNPQRRGRPHRRRSSLQHRLDNLDTQPHVEIEDEKTARVEQWRLEQSRAVLEEIERETRRRRRRMARTNSGSIHEIGSSLRRHETNSSGETHVPENHDGNPPVESFWRRITRRVIRDLIGLDDSTLSIIFGETIVEDSPTPKEASPIAAAAARQESRVTFDDGHTWQDKLLERVARELGILVHQLAEHDGAAFSTYRRILNEAPEYAGIPHNYPRQPSYRSRVRAERQAAGLDRQEGAAATTNDNTTDAATNFMPTLARNPLTPGTEPTDTSLWGIEEEVEPNSEETTGAAQLRQEREYWERDIDANLLLSYLKSRFSRATKAAANLTNQTTTQSSSTLQPPLPASWATTFTPTRIDPVRRAEVIRRQHPLVSRAADRAAAQQQQAQQRTRRESLLLLRRHQQFMHRRTGSSSCASQSTRRSRKSRSASSRHYWDLGGSVGSAGLGGSAGGGWGEV